MSSEFETVNDIIEQEIRDASEATVSSGKSRSEFDVLLEALNTMEKDRTLEHWRTMFFNEQQNRCEFERELSRVQRKYLSCDNALHRAGVNMTGVRKFSGALDEFLVRWGLNEPDAHVGVMVKIARSFLREVTLRVELPALPDMDDDGIPF